MILLKSRLKWAAFFVQKHVDLATMDNNDVFKKLRVALHLKDTDIVEILKLSNYEIGTSELNAFFRSEDHPNYKECGDQILRNFLNGLIIYKRGPAPEKKAKPEISAAEKKFQGKKLKAPGIQRPSFPENKDAGNQRPRRPI